jgi:hypothetical protein
MEALHDLWAANLSSQLWLPGEWYPLRICAKKQKRLSLNVPFYVGIAANDPLGRVHPHKMEHGPCIKDLVNPEKIIES